jgi:alkyl hydroperoxide reductase subunit AhpC
LLRKDRPSNHGIKHLTRHQKDSYISDETLDIILHPRPNTGPFAFLEMRQRFGQEIAMPLNSLLLLNKVRQSLTGTPGRALNGKHGRRPGDIFPNFLSQTTAGPIDFWDWAEGNWVYIFGLSGSFSTAFDQLLSYAVASDVLDDAGVKVLCVSRMNLGLLQELSVDVSAIAGQPMTARLVADQDAKLAQSLGLQEQNDGSDATLHKSFLIGPDLRIKTIEVSSSPITRTCHQTMQLVNSMQRAAPRASEPQKLSDLWAELPVPQS